jgi:hypothetical protein
VDSFELAVAAQNAINRSKTDAAASIGRPVNNLTLRAAPATWTALAPVLPDVLAAARCAKATQESVASIAPGTIEVAAIELMDQARE